jgi:hypothetical protein
VLRQDRRNDHSGGREYGDHYDPELRAGADHPRGLSGHLGSALPISDDFEVMGFGYRLYPSYNGYNGVGRKDIDEMIDPLIAEHDELPKL